MSLTGSVSIVIIVLLVLVLFVLFIIIIKMQGNKSENIGNLDKNEQIKIEDLLKIASNVNTSKSQLSQAIIKVSNSFPFPKKNKDMLKNDELNLTEEQKKYLTFVLLISSHKNSDAKLIAFMDKELKMKNPDYKKEIDAYEDEGLEIRKYRD